MFLNSIMDFLFYLVSFLLACLCSGVVRCTTCIHQVFLNINCYFVVRHKNLFFIIHNITLVVVCQYSRFLSYLKTNFNMPPFSKMATEEQLRSMGSFDIFISKAYLTSVHFNLVRFVRSNLIFISGNLRL